MSIIPTQDALAKIGAYRKTRKNTELKSAFISAEDLKALGAFENGIRVYLGHDKDGALILIPSSELKDAEGQATSPARYSDAPSCPPSC